MSILSRYIIRSHLGPLFFTFSLLTGLVFVSAVAQRLDALAGKGLPKEIIFEALILLFPFTIALTLPMAVLPAVLYAFSELAANGEIVAMSGGGVRPRRLFLPTMFMGVVLTGATLFFNDRVLPEANHRLKNLQIAIRQKSPTFQLRESVVNVIRGEGGLGPYYLSATAIDPESSSLSEVVIHDLSRAATRRTTYADRGTMHMNGAFTDLQLRLYDGHSYEVRTLAEPGSFRRMSFDKQVYVLRGVADIFEAEDGSYRSDREMPLRMLWDSVSSRTTRLDSMAEESRAETLTAVQQALGEEVGAPGGGTWSPAHIAGADGPTRRVSFDAHARQNRYDSLKRQANRYGVEFHKKLVIASACMIFVLIGMPLGVRFQRGGISMVIVVSALVIGIYQYGLSTGEDWADRNRATPFWAMWTPSIGLTVVGGLLATRIGSWTASSRDSGWRELWLEGRSALARLAPRRRRR